MKKLMFVLATVAAFMAVSCTKTENEETPGTTGANETPENTTSIIGRWEAPRFADTPEDIAFVALFGETDLDLYIIALGQHLKGTYTWANDSVNYNITEAYRAYTGVTFDDSGNMTDWSWEAGNLDAATLTLTEGYNWYPMTEEDMNRAKEDFGKFEFKVNGNTATSTLVGIEDLTFNKIN